MIVTCKDQSSTIDFSKGGRGGVHGSILFTKGKEWAMMPKSLTDGHMGGVKSASSFLMP